MLADVLCRTATATAENDEQCTHNSVGNSYEVPLWGVAQRNTVSSGMGTTNWPPQSLTCAIWLTTSSRRFHGRIST
jgi:hypothetical protein